MQYLFGCFSEILSNNSFRYSIFVVNNDIILIMASKNISFYRQSNQRRSTMGNFREKLARFMYGRYGADQLYYCLLILNFVLMLINSFLMLAILDITVWAILILMIYRTFSRNIYKRQLENQKFLKVWYPIKSKFSLFFVRVKEIRTNRYRRCTHCKSMLRLPRRTGKHAVTCPRCHKDFDVRVLL